MLTRLKLHHESLLPFQFAASQLLILLSDSVLHCRVCCDELCVRTVQLRGTTVEPKQKKIMCSPWFSRCWISRFNRPVSFFANACSRARRRSSLFYGWRWVRSHSRFDQCCESQTFFSSRLRCALPTLVWVKVIASRDGYTYAKRPLG